MLCLAIYVGSLAQNNRIVYGMVVDKDGCPIINAMVMPIGLQQSVVTGDDGKFQISVPYSVREMRVSAKGCYAQVQEIDGSFLLFKMNYNSNYSADANKTVQTPTQDVSAKAPTKPSQSITDSGNQDETVVKDSQPKMDQATLDRIAYAQKLLEEQARRDSLKRAKEEAKSKKNNN